jgi:hypothetical protein
MGTILYGGAESEVPCRISTDEGLEILITEIVCDRFGEHTARRNDDLDAE